MERPLTRTPWSLDLEQQLRQRGLAGLNGVSAELIGAWGVAQIRETPRRQTPVLNAFCRDSLQGNASPTPHRGALTPQYAPCRKGSGTGRRRRDHRVQRLERNVP